MRATSPSNFGPDRSLDFDVYAQSGASEGQMDFIVKLRLAWQTYESDLARLSGREEIVPTWRDPASREEASAMIDKGKAARDAKRAELHEVLHEGIYTDGEDYWQVKISRTSGLPYAKHWDVETTSWTFNRDNIHDVIALAHPATVDEASAFGVRFGFCHCGRLLTNPDSVARGIGPICAERY